MAAVSVFALVQWDASFNTPYRERVAVASRIPPGLFMAIDAAAWRWIIDRPAVVTPSDPGRAGAACRLLQTRVAAMVIV